MIGLVFALAVSSTVSTSTSTTVTELAFGCADDEIMEFAEGSSRCRKAIKVPVNFFEDAAKCQARNADLRESMEKIAASEEDLLSHWPSLLAGAACIAGVSVLAERSDKINEGATTAMIGGCGVLGFLLDDLTWSPE